MPLCGLPRVAVVGCAALAVCVALGCRERKSAPAPAAGAAGGARGTEVRALHAPLDASPAPPAAARERAVSSEPALRPPPDVRLLPPDRPWQHLAFSEERLAQLSDEELVVRALPGLRIAARITVPGARNVVAGVGGDFVAAGSDHVYRLARLDTRAELLAPVPRLGPTVVLPAADSSDHFWLLYEGIARVPEFDLQETVLTPYVSVLSWTELSELDGRAVASRGEGTFIYTTARGLRSVDAEGSSRELAVAGLGADVWRLLPEPQSDGLWVATRRQVEHIAPLTAPRRGARLALPAHTVALAARGRELALLAVEAIGERRAQLRVEVYSRAEPSAEAPEGMRLRQVLHHEERLAASPDAGPSRAPAPRFAPEVALAPGRPWLAVNGFGLAVFDWRTGKRLLPREADAQKLAPGSP